MGILHVMSLADAANMEKQEKPNFNVNFECFKTPLDAEKDEIYSKKKAKATNDATKLWLKCFEDYLEEKGLPQSEKLTDRQLSEVLYHFYTEVRKKKIDSNDNNDGSYKTQTLRCIWDALGRHFKDTHSIDITNNEMFLKANKMFIGMTKLKKENGLGDIESYPPIEEADLEKLTQHFKDKINGPPDARILEQTVMFYIIYYLCSEAERISEK